MASKLAHWLEFIAICTIGLLVILSGMYAVDHAESRMPIIVVTGGGVGALVAFAVTSRNRGLDHWFRYAITFGGCVLLALLVVFTGGLQSELWPGFLLVTVAGAMAFDRRRAAMLYVLATLALSSAAFSGQSVVRYYDLVTVLSRICVVVAPAELYRQIRQVKEQQHVELLLSAQRESKTAQDLKRRNVELNLFNNVALTLNSSLDLDVVLRKVIELTNASLGIEIGSVLLVDEESGDLVIRTLVGKGASQVDGLHIPRGKGIASWVFEHRETVLVDDAQSDPRFYGKVDEVSGFTTRSLLCIPLSSRDREIGVIEAMNKTVGSFTVEDQQLLEALAAIAAPAVDRALLHSRLRRTNQELEQRYDELQQTQADLVAAERRAAAVELAGGAAHELNQPLTVIQCSMDMLHATLGPEHAGTEDLMMLDRAVQRIAEIVRKIGSITRFRTKTYAGDIRIVDLNQSQEGDIKQAASQD